MEQQTPVANSDTLAATIARADGGDRSANDALFAALYNELHSIAESHLRRASGQVTIGATTLLHEAYLDLNSRRHVVFPDRLRFLKYASRAMRGLIIDYVRTKRAQKRGGELAFVSMANMELGNATAAAGLQRLSDALDELARVDGPLAELVDLKFFCGFSFTEIAALRGVSDRTIQRDWAKARVVLHESLRTVE